MLSCFGLSITPLAVFKLIVFAFYIVTLFGLDADVLLALLLLGILLISFDDFCYFIAVFFGITPKISFIFYMANVYYLSFSFAKI